MAKRKPSKQTLGRKFKKDELLKKVTVSTLRKLAGSKGKGKRTKKALSKVVTKSKLLRKVPKKALLPKSKAKSKPKPTLKPKFGVRLRERKNFSKTTHWIYVFDGLPTATEVQFIQSIRTEEGNLCYIRAKVLSANGETDYRSAGVTFMDEAVDFLDDSIKTIYASNAAKVSGVYEQVIEWSMVVIVKGRVNAKDS
jgi:hypothetical protein